MFVPSVMKDKRNEYICDIEADGLRADATQIWCIVTKCVATQRVDVFLHDDLERFRTWYHDTQPVLIGHGFLSYDAPVIGRLLGIDIPLASIVDTIIMSRIYDPGRRGGHSLDSWGKTLGFPKLPFNDFASFSREMVKYCKNDVELNYRVYLHLQKLLRGWSGRSIRVEHATQWVLDKQRDDGFPFDIQGLRNLQRRLTDRREELHRQIRSDFKPRSCPVDIRKTRTKSDGTLSVVGIPKEHRDWFVERLHPGSEYAPLVYQEFNLGSPKQIVERMNLAGWKPVEKTKGHLQCEQQLRRRTLAKDKRRELEARLEEYRTWGWRVSEKNLSTLPPTAPPAARGLAEYLMLTARLVKLDELERAYDPADGAVHGTTISLGASTHRMAHFDPNLSNIPSLDSPYGGEIRELFRALDRNTCLVGVDASGIQLRLLAHLMGDAEYVRQILDGDIHSYNAHALGDVERSNAKTFIYAFLLGAGIGKIAEILECSAGEAKERMKLFYENIPGLAYVKDEWVPKAWSQGYFTAIDGRRIRVYLSEHKVLASYLQGTEKIVMAEAMLRWRKRAAEEGIDFTQHLVSHDEWQCSVPPHQAWRFGRLQRAAIRETGEFFNLNCPLDGGIILGRTWKDTH